MKQAILEKNLLLKLCMIFLIIQPILDIYILFEPEVISFFHFSPSTIIRIGVMGLLILLLLITVKWEKKHIWIGVYLVLIVIYTILHHFHAVTTANVRYNLSTELFYIIRMLLPLAMVLISYYIKFSKKQVETIITWLVILVSGSIVVTNLLGISLNSYTNLKIGGSILDWFTRKNVPYTIYSSKGFFMYANQIAALELLLTPILFYFVIKKPNFKNICLVIIQLLATFMLGTKVATLGFILIFGIMTFLYIFFCFIKKELYFSIKPVIVFAILLGLSIIIYPKTPMKNRSSVSEEISTNYTKETVEKETKNENTNNLQNKIENEKVETNESKNSIVKEENQTENKKTKQCRELRFVYTNPVQYKYYNHITYVEPNEMCKSQSELEQEKLDAVEKQLKNLNSEEEQKQYLISFIHEEYGKFGFLKDFVEIAYSYKEDPFFWYNEIRKPLNDRINYRVIEEDMLKRIKELRNDKKDDYLGITYSTMSNVFNLERDFLSHYYSLGWIGLTLFLFPYLIILFFCMMVMLLYFKRKVTFYNCSLTLSIGIALFAAYYSGNVMDGLVVSIILGFVIGQLVQSVFYRNRIFDKKVSVIMPTYNDSKTIQVSLDSLMKQTYQNWELVIVDDGSTDDTKRLINEYQKKYDKENKIQYIYQKNQDQLKAIIHGTKYITGDYVFILHSDDLLASSDTFEKAVSYMNEHKELDAIIAPLLLINEKGRLKGCQEVLSYSKNKKIPVIQMLWLGRNLYADVGFFKKEIYISKIKETYLTWNMPFWLNIGKKVTTLNVETVEFEMLKYRVHSENYINNELGKLNVINGELRTLTSLMKFYDIPNYKKQYIIFRIFSHLHLLKIYKPKYYERECQNKSQILEFVIQKRFGEDYKRNIFLNSLVEFYKQEKKRKIEFSKIYHGEEIYQGNDMRKFNKRLLENNLPEFYQKMLEEMQKGFDEVIVKTEEEKEKAIQITQFLCINPKIKLTK